MLSLIGNAPSSGSTLLADLLDSSRVSACGPELNLFSQVSLYNDFSKFKKQPFLTSSCSSVYVTRTITVANDLCAYGLNKKKLKILINNSHDVNDFSNNISASFLSIRGKEMNGVVFEKTPQNICSIDKFLLNNDGFFVHIVRNPIYVYRSLLKRGFSPSIALITWMIDEAKFLKHMDHDKVILIKYEDLVKNPYMITSQIIERTSGKKIHARTIEDNFKNNNYRKYHSFKVDTWNEKTFGHVGNSNTGILTNKEKLELSKLMNLKIGHEYAKKFGLMEVSFLEIVEILNYSEDFLSLIDESKGGKFTVDRFSRVRLLRKFAADYKNGDTSISELNLYLNPVDKIN